MAYKKVAWHRAGSDPATPPADWIWAYAQDGVLYYKDEAGAEHVVAQTGTALTNVRVSAGTTSNLLSAITFANSNGVSFGINASTVTASVAAGGGDAIRGIAAGGSTASTSTVNFSNSNGVSFGFGAAGNSTVLTASHNAITSQSNQQMTLFATGNTTQSSTGTSNASSLVFRGEGVASIGITGGSVVVSVPAGGGGLTNIRVSAGTTSNLLSDVTFANSNGVTFGLNASTITASVAAAGGGATVSHWPWHPVDVSISSMNTGTTAATGGSTQTTASFHIFPLALPAALHYSRLEVERSFASIAGTGSASHQLMIGVYTENAGTRLDSLSTFFFRHEMSQNSVTAQTHRWYHGTNSTSNSSGITGNSSANITGIRAIPLYGASASFSAGQYFVVVGIVNRTSGSNVWPASSLQCMSIFNTAFGGELGSASTKPPFPRMGQFSTTTNVNVLTTHCIPATIHTSVITGTGGTSQWKWPLVIFKGTTN